MTASRPVPEYNGRHPHYLLLERAKKAAAKAEREQMLGKIFEYMSSHGVEKRPEGYYVVSGTFSLGGFVKFLESLRQQEERR